MADARSSFVYVTYIRTTPEELWAALTTPEFTRKFWFGMKLETAWKVGARWQLVAADGAVTDAGVVREFDRPRRIVLAWNHVRRPELAAEGEALCVMELEPQEKAVKLTITHTIDRAESKLIGAEVGATRSCARGPDADKVERRGVVPRSAANVRVSGVVGGEASRLGPRFDRAQKIEHDAIELVGPLQRGEMAHSG